MNGWEIFALLVFIALAAIYFFMVRPALTRWALLAPFWADEATLFQKIRTVIDGLKTKLLARTVTIASAVVGAYDFLLPYLTSQDWTPITSKIPSYWMPIMGLSLGVVFDYLRSISNKPAAS